MMWATKAVGAGAVAFLLATPAFAQSRGDWSRNNQSNRGAQATQTRAENRGGHDNQASNYNNTNNNTQYQYRENRSAQQATQTRVDNRSNSYRENQRVTESGRITSFARERDGYRVGLDRGGSYWVPESRGRGLRVGLSVNLGGIFNGGSFIVDNVGYPAGYAYETGYVRGVVDRVDYRTGTVWLQDDASGAEIRAAVGNGYALNGLRQGEFVELTGQWLGGGVFNVARIASIR
jgi:hypothetical protein